MIEDYVIYFNAVSNTFGARRVTESLPNGSAPAAIVENGVVVWTCKYTSVSFPSGKEVNAAVAAFIAGLENGEYRYFPGAFEYALGEAVESE